jgi:anti-sigma regulatory factor (Ser/Thr protein kinase)
VRSVFQRSLRPELPALPDAAAAVREWLAREGVEPHVIHAIDFALEELVTNSIRHALRGRESRGEELGLRVETTLESVELLVDDGGAAFDPTRAATPAPFVDLASAPVGGRGLDMLRRLTPDVRYERVGERNLTRVRVLRTRASG